MRTCALAVMVLFAVGCGPQDPSVDDEVTGDVTGAIGSWQKIGTLPQGLGSTSPGGMDWAHNKLWVNMEDRVQEGRFGTGWTWRTAYDAAYRVMGIGHSSTHIHAGVQYETIRRAPSTGNGWLVAGATLPGPVYDFATAPNGVVYGDIEGQIVRSNDAGATWTLVYNQPYDWLYTDGCIIDVVAGDPGKLYQNCKGFWQDWLIFYDISSSTANPLPDPILSVDSNLIPDRAFGSAIASAGSSDSLYVGMNGGLLWVNGQDWYFIWDGDPDQQVDAIWVDPANSNHLLFGGRHLTQNKLILMETFDGGATVTPRPAPTTLGLQNPVVKAFTAAGSGLTKLAMAVETGPGGYTPPSTVVIWVNP